MWGVILSVRVVRGVSGQQYGLGTNWQDLETSEERAEFPALGNPQRSQASV